MINPFIKLTGTDGYGSKRTLFLNVNQICGYFIDTRGHNTKIVSDAEIFYALETPEKISAMIQKYYDEQMHMEFIRDVLIGISSQMNNIDRHVIGFVCSNAKSTRNAMMEVLKDD